MDAGCFECVLFVVLDEIVRMMFKMDLVCFLLDLIVNWVVVTYV